MSRFTKLVALFAIVALSGLFAFAQTESGQLSGVVTDASGAVVQGVKVTATSVERSFSRTATTGNNGGYVISNLQPGTYDVTFEGANFGKQTRRIGVTVGGRQTLDATLKAQGTITEVEVVDTAPIAEVNTTDGQLSTVVGSKQITEVPTITRNPYNLVNLSGNVSDVDPSGRGAGVSINGARSASTDVLLDGAENVDLFGAVVGQNTPLDSVAEFRVITSNFTAEYGRASGGIVNVSTKSGSNTFHGTLYEFNRISALASRTFAEADANRVDKATGGTGTPMSPFTRNQFGYSLGGPIMKDKLFFFSSTEWTRVRSNGTQTVVVPHPDFIASAAANTQAFFSAFGQLKPGGFSSVIPGTVGTYTGNIWGVFNYQVPSDAGAGSPQNSYSSANRVDWNLSDKTQIYGRYALESQKFFEGTNANSPYVGFDTGVNVFNNNILVNISHVFSPSLVSNSKIVFNRLNNIQPLGKNPPGPTLYMRSTTTRVNGNRVAMPGYLPFNPGSAIPFGGPQNLYQLYQDLSWNHGNHQWKFGGQYIHTRDNRVFGAYEESVETLGNSVSSALTAFRAGTLRSFATAVNPQGKFPCPINPTTGAAIVSPECTVTLPVGFPQFGRNNRYHDWAAYAQDNWKVTSRVTLNLGVRYEYYGVQHNANPALDSNFYYGSGSTIFDQIRNGSVQIAKQSPVHNLWTPDRNNFAPRLGFAWDIFGNGKTSFRGGYGIAYERNFGNVTFNVIQNPPNYAVVSLTSADVGGTLNITTNNAGPLTGSGSKALPRSSLRWVDQNLSTAYNQFWSAAIDQQLARNTVLSLEYTGSHGVKLYTIENPNRPGSGRIYEGDAGPGGEPMASRLNYQYTSLNRRGGGGFSHYNALNVALKSSNLFNLGITTSTNYTWAHAQDNLSSTFSESNNNFNLGLLDPFNPRLDYGNADYDLRHRLVTSMIWDIPWGKKSDSAIVRHALAGWELSPSFEATAGAPFTMFDCTTGFEVCYRYIPSASSFPHSGNATRNPDPTLANTYNYLTLPANVVYSNPLTAGGACGPDGCGDFGPYPANMTRRNAFRGPMFWKFDLGVFKNIQLTEKYRLQFRGEFFNVLNHHNQFVDGSNADASVSLTVPAVKGGFGSSSDERRNVQLGIKFIF